MLSLDQKKFVKEYIKDLNATQAYIRLTGDTQNASRKSVKYSHNPEIKAEIQKELQRKLEEIDIDSTYVLSNIKKVLDTAMARTPISTSEDGTPITSYDPTTALKATEQLGKYLKLFTDRTENINVQTDFEEYIKKVESDDEY